MAWFPCLPRGKQHGLAETLTSRSRNFLIGSAGLHAFSRMIWRTSFDQSECEFDTGSLWQTRQRTFSARCIMRRSITGSSAMSFASPAKDRVGIRHSSPIKKYFHFACNSAMSGSIFSPQILRRDSTDQLVGDHSVLIDDIISRHAIHTVVKAHFAIGISK